MIKIREFPDKNYRAIFFNGKTVRIALNPSLPIQELDYPEFYDIKITSYCEGNCPYCYTNSKCTNRHTFNIVHKVKEFFGNLTESQRPFQVAIGGGEPTSHPEFKELLRTFKNLGIVPNYTTNGMWTSLEKSIIHNLLQETKHYCGGVALSCHPHLIKHWTSAINFYITWGIKPNLHIIISNKESIDYFKKLYLRYFKDVKYFVLLPYIVKGRATPKDINWEYLVRNLPSNLDNIAFGARFYDCLKSNSNFKISLYEPEIMSKFLDLETMKIFKSSFE